MSVRPTHPCFVVIFPLQMVVMSSLAAAVQGMDEAVINGAQIIYPAQFGIGDPKSSKYPSSTSDGPPGHVSHSSERDGWLVGLVNSAPYLYVLKLSNQSHPDLIVYTGVAQPFLAGCLIPSINGSAARKLSSSLVLHPSCIWSGLTNSWWHLFIARFFLGFGIGPKSATVPVYAAECSPAPIRGALVMMW